MARRMRRSEQRAIGFLLIAAVAAYLVAKFVVVLAVIAGIVIAALLAKKLFTGPHVLALRGPERSQPVMERPALFTAPIHIDRGVFAQDADVIDAAHRVFAHWAAQLPMVPRDCESVIRGVKVHRRLITRCESELMARRAVWRCAPIAGRRPIGGAPPVAYTVDPWTNDPLELAEESRYIASCDQCDGSGRVSCSECGAIGRILCRACQGSRKAYGYAANGAYRLLNCRACNGKGSLRCEMCRSGQAACGQCDGLKNVECWLEIVTSTRIHVMAVPCQEGDAQIYPWTQRSAQEAEIQRDGSIAGHAVAQYRLAPRTWKAQAPIQTL
jgi:hypothetical protein